jgi:chromosome segregation ATPase
MSETMSGSDERVETRIEVEPQEAAAERGTLAVSADEFAALEDRVRRTVEVVRRERQARAAAESRATDAEAKVLAQAAQVEHLQSELNALRAERDQVRQRVERVLKQLDALEL